MPDVPQYWTHQPGRLCCRLSLASRVQLLIYLHSIKEASFSLLIWLSAMQAVKQRRDRLSSLGKTPDNPYNLRTAIGGKVQFSPLWTLEHIRCS
ncbi:hypothetical protein Y1Q_0022106 [Alligator mississippiensis]|uniref:Uncharacterized protein n=1 Tax=Alligator mississippiensis TaxID=8496 RepID=A0A151M4M9_ALLMI|nr:hypothetical protein Y1Q_0022106 [Alligator mississippiensis]